VGCLREMGYARSDRNRALSGHEDRWDVIDSLKLEFFFLVIQTQEALANSQLIVDQLRFLIMP
jgi:hypothetical protein